MTKNSLPAGLIAAPHTPFRKDRSVALDAIARQAHLLSRNGVVGAFVCGTTGEGSSLTGEERRRIVEAWVEAAPRSPALVVHVGHTSWSESAALARHAQESGADAIATVAPSYLKPPTAVELVGWCARVAAAAPELPFYYYHMPAMTGVGISAHAFYERARDRIPTLAGIKFTDEDLMDFGRTTAAAAGRCDVLFGRDEILLAGLSLGARGAVGSTYNFAAPLYHRILRNFAAGDLAAARRDQLKAMEMVTVLDRYGGLAAGKAVMKLIGLDCGPVRLPLRALPAAAERRLKADLQTIGFFSFCCRA